MKIIAFDVGIKNLAFCEIETNEQGNVNISDWNVIDIGKHATFDQTMAALIDALDKLAYNKLYDTVLIENQPVIKNPIMKSIQIGIFTYFCTIRFYTGSVRNVVNSSASCKLKVSKNNENTKNLKYSEIKKLGVKVTELYLNDKYLEWFRNHKKRDDLADCFLHAVRFLETQGIEVRLQCDATKVANLNEAELVSVPKEQILNISEL